jgi:hypothetical protein
MAEPLLRAVHDGDEVLGLSSDPVRARSIEVALSRATLDTQVLWPRLDTVSAWADGASRPAAQRLSTMLPHAMVQPKGLLATEGAITTPYGASWSVPALTSAFLEFIDESGEPRLCDELRAGEGYRVVLTNAGGFYRYDPGDRLRCHGYEGNLPLLEFVGREAVSDLVGEKLSEHFVSDALALVGEAACLAPRPAAPPFYELMMESDGAREADASAALVEQRLRRNPQYDYARRLGQLGPVKLRPVVRLLDRYLRFETARGRRLGDVKPPTLVRDPDTYAALTN